MRLDGDLEPCRKLQDLAKHRAERYFAERLAHDRIGDGADRLGELRQRHMITKHAGIGVELGHRVIVAVEHRRQQTGQKQPFAEIEMTHDAEIDRHQRAAGRHENIPRMHVGMEEAIAEDLVEKGPGRRFGNLADVMSGSTQRLDIINADSLDPLDDEHAGGGVLEIDPRHGDAGIVGHVLRQLAGGGGLEPQIELHRGDLGELVDSGDELQPPQVRRHPFQQACQRIEQGCVGLHAAVDSRPQQLHRHTPAVGKLGVMNLGNRCRRHGLVIETAEKIRYRHAGFRFDAAACQRPRKSREPVLQKAQRMSHFRPDEVGPCRQRLAELDEPRPKADQRLGQRTAGITPRVAGTHHPVEAAAQMPHPARKKGDLRDMAKRAGPPEMPGDHRQPEHGEHHLQGRDTHQSSFHPEWMQAMPADRRRTRTCAKPAPANISASTSGVGNVRMDSTR